MLLPPDGIRPITASLAFSFDVSALCEAIDDYLGDLQRIVNVEFNHMDDPAAYVQARDYLNAVEQMRSLLGEEG